MSPRNIQCAECHWTYPHSYLAPLRTSEGNTADVCGVCALMLSNKALGVNRSRFFGRMAEHLRQMALTWRDNHPDLAPKPVPQPEPQPVPKEAEDAEKPAAVPEPEA